MPERIESLYIDGPVGRLEALLEEPDPPTLRMAALVCHPHPLHAGTMRNKVTYRLARGLRRAGAAALRFNFRGVGSSQGSHGNLVGEVEDARAALAWLRARYPDLPFGLAGFSFGARVIAELGCQTPGVRWLIAAGYPTRYAADSHVDKCEIPKTFILSTHDQYAPRSEFEAMYARFAEPKRLIWVEASDHFFASGLDEFEQGVFESVA